MKDINSSRRLILKQMATMGVAGALTSLRSLPLAASETKNNLNSVVPSNVIHRQHEDYEIWRQSMHWHHSKPERYPAVIVQAQSEQEVVAAINLARQQNHKIAVRASGHNAAGSAVRNGGMLLDVAGLNELKIDAANKIASIQPGVKSLQLVTEAREHGLCYPVPHCPSVSVTGFSMGGGIGWNYSQLGGMACFSIDSAEVVLANGKKVIASQDQNPDLLWAIRGIGPGFFGVVTRANLKLYPVPKAIMASSYILALDDLTMVTETLDELVKVKDDRVEALLLLTHDPSAAADTAPEQAKICFVTAFAFADTEQETKELLMPFTESKLAKQNLSMSQNQSFSFEGLFDTFFSLEVPAGMMARYMVDNVMTNEPAKVLHALVDHFKTAPSPHAHVLAGYGMNLKTRADACFSSAADCYLGCYAIWDKAENDAVNYRWLEQCLPLMDPFANGHYANEVEPRFNSDRLRQCFSDEAWARLGRLRAKYDPDGLFHKHLGQS